MEVSDDPEKIGFALSSLYPGRIHAHGKIVRAHRIHFSVGRSGVYRMFVGLRPQSKLLPGAPYAVNVLPGMASARWTRVDKGAAVYATSNHAEEDARRSPIVLMAVAGEAREKRRGPTVVSCDMMGNRCIAGGARVSVECEQELSASTFDEDDGTYSIWWASSGRAGTYRMHVTLDGLEVVNATITVIVSPAHPDTSKFAVSGTGLTFATAGSKANVRVCGYDECGNACPNLSSSSIKFGMALVQCEGEAALAARRAAALPPGLNWQEIAAKPKGGTLVTNIELSAALASGKTSFTEAELESFQVKGLDWKAYISGSLRQVQWFKVIRGAAYKPPPKAIKEQEATPSPAPSPKRRIGPSVPRGGSFSGALRMSALAGLPIFDRCFHAWKSFTAAKLSGFVRPEPAQGEYTAAEFEACGGVRAAESLTFEGEWKKTPGERSSSPTEADRASGGAGGPILDSSRNPPIEEFYMAYVTETAGHFNLHVWVCLGSESTSERVELPGSPFLTHVQETEASAANCVVEAEEELKEGTMEVAARPDQLIEFGAHVYDRFGNHTSAANRLSAVVVPVTPVADGDASSTTHSFNQAAQSADIEKGLPQKSTGKGASEKSARASEAKRRAPRRLAKASSAQLRAEETPRGRRSSISSATGHPMSSPSSSPGSSPSFWRAPSLKGSFRGSSKDLLYSSGLEVERTEEMEDEEGALGPAGADAFTRHELEMRPVHGRPGVYGASYVADAVHPMIVGEYKIAIFLDDKELLGSPLRYKVLPGPPHVPNCVLFPPKFAYIRGVGSRPVQIGLKTYDQWGNACDDGGAAVKAVGRDERSHGPQEIDAPTDRKDGTYVFAVEQQHPGPFELTISVDGVDMPKLAIEFTDPKALVKAAEESEHSFDSDHE